MPKASGIQCRDDRDQNCRHNHAGGNQSRGGSGHGFKGRVNLGDNHRVGYRSACGRRGGHARGSVAAPDDAVCNNQWNTRDDDDGNTQHNAQQAGFQNHVQVDGIAQREAEERDQYRGGFAEEITQIVIEVAQRKTNQERQDRPDKMVWFKRGKAEPRINIVISGPDSRDISTNAPDSSLVPY